MDIAKLLKGTASHLMGAGLFFMLFLLAYFFVFSQVTAKPDRVKSILNDSGVYSKIPEVIYDNSLDEEDSAGPTDIPLKSPVVRQAALDAFSPDFVQSNMEKAIDGIYGWLDGQTSEPQFRIDLKDAKNDFAGSLGDGVSKRLKDLPRCTARQMQKLRQFNVFTSPCLPPGTNIKALVKQVRALAKSDDELFKDTQISPATIKDSSERPVYKNYPDAPKAYQTTTRLPYVLLLLCVLLASGVIFISEQRKTGLKRVGKLLAASGILVVLLPFVINRALDGLLRSSPGDKIVNDLVLPVMHEFAKTAGRFYLIVGGFYLVLAVGIFLLARKMSENNKSKGKA